jgi:uncharacterized BrkB/YihY/UPF0761 family membrane protein
MAAVVDRTQAAVTAVRGRRDHAKSCVAELRTRHDSLDFALSVTDHDSRTGGGLLAGAIAFRLFLWILPAMLVLVGGLGFVNPNSAHSAASGSGLGGFTASTIRTASSEAHHGRWVILIAGLIALYSASATLAKTVFAATALEWGLPVRRPAQAPKAAAVVVALLGLTIAAGVFVNWLRHEVSALGVLAIIANALIWTTLAWLVSMLLPHADGVGRFGLVPGAAVIGAGIQVLHLVTVFYLANKVSSASKLYGALGGAATLLLWAYLLARLIIAAAAVNHIFALRRRGRSVTAA